MKGIQSKDSMKSTMNNLKQAVDQHALNQEEMLSNIHTKIAKKTGERRLRRLGMSALSVFAVFALGLTLLNNGVFNVSAKTVSIVAIDINPSFELSVDAEGIVIRVKAVNKDAKEFDTKSLIGLPATEATQKILDWAKEAGYLNPEDLDEDYVLVTTVNTDDEEEEATEELEENLKSIILAGGDISDYHVVMMKASKIVWFESQEKKVPLGMYVINGMVQHEGVWLTAGEYFSDPANKQNLEKRAEIIEKNQNRERTNIGRFIDKLERENEDVSALRLRLENPNEDLDALLTDVKEMWSATHETTDIDAPKGKPENPGNSKK